MITKGVKKLSKPDSQPTILFERSSLVTIAYLVVVRDGDTTTERISKRVAAELIAAGFSHGS